MEDDKVYTVLTVTQFLILQRLPVINKLGIGAHIFMNTFPLLRSALPVNP